MKQAIKLLAGILAMSALSACSAEYMGPDDQIYGNIRGIVTDMEGTPVNHIKVTISQPQHHYPTIVYTSIRGEFIADMHLEGDRIDILMEDIDGEENGGLFESLSDVITMLDSSASTISLEYRLNRATASENSQRSL